MSFLIVMSIAASSSDAAEFLTSTGGGKKTITFVAGA
jgi:hypothetical protein